MKNLIFIFLSAIFIFPTLLAQNSLELTRTIYQKKFIDEKHDSIDNILLRTKAVDFKFRTIKGDSLQLSSLEGDVVIMTVFFCLCGPCMKEIPLFNKLAKEYTTKGATFIAISTMDTPASIKIMENFLSNKGQDSTYTNEVRVIPASYLGSEDVYRNTQELIDSGYKNETKDFLRENYFISSAPVTFFIDKKGVIQFISRGYNTEYDYYTFYKNEIENILKE